MIGVVKEIGVTPNSNKRRMNNMWVITLFDQENVRIFEYAKKEEATNALKSFSKTALLSYTR